MKNEKIKKVVISLLVAVTVMGSLAGCQKKEATSQKSDSGATVIKVAYQANAYPLAYTDEDGNVTGYEIEVLKLVDEKLTDYEFEYIEAGNQEAQYTGLSSGKYDVALSNAFYTDERDKAYNLPKNPLGASLVGIVTKKDDESITDFASAAKLNKKLSPILAGDGLYFVVKKYNDENPDNQIDLQATDDPNSFTNSLSWVDEGRYDFTVYPKNYYEILVGSEDGKFHEYNDKLRFVECRSVYTYPVIAKSQTDFAAAVDQALGEIKETGVLNELSEKFYGYDAFAYESSN